MGVSKQQAQPQAGKPKRKEKKGDEDNVFNVFWLAPDGKKKNEVDPFKIPPKPKDPNGNAKPKSRNEEDANKRKEAEKNRIFYAEETSKDEENFKAGNASNKDAALEEARRKKKEEKVETAEELAARKEAEKKRQNDFLSWVTNGQEHDIHMCHNVLFQ